MPTSRGSHHDEPGVRRQRDAGEGEVEAGGLGHQAHVGGEGEGRPGPAATPFAAATTGFAIVASAVAIGL